MGAVGRDEVVRGVAVTAVAFWLLRKLARDMGREAELLGRRTRADVDASNVVDAAVAVLRAETDVLLHKTVVHMQDLAGSSRLHCRLGHGASLFCEIEPKNRPVEVSGVSTSSSAPPALHGNVATASNNSS